MPLYEYRCADCQELLELFLQPSDPEPRLCGYRCPLGRDDDRRGFGQLGRALSAPAPALRPALLGDSNTVQQMENAGFTVYRNDGSGLTRAAGKLGPARVTDKE